MATLGGLKTFTRIRPFSKSELAPTTKAARFSMEPAVDIKNECDLMFNPSRLKAKVPMQKLHTSRLKQKYDQQYSFDGVFDADCTETDVYRKVAEPQLILALQGVDSSVFAYGATGCGKSHTVSQIVQQLAADLFEKVRELNEDFSYEISLSYFQLYNEKIIDLVPQPFDMLTPNSKVRRTRNAGLLDLRGVNKVSIPGLSEYSISCAEDILDHFSRGNHSRVVASTKANTQSSRSHAILRFNIRQTDNISDTTRTSSFTVIDLAGSERAQSTENRGRILAEGAGINKSLLALGKCITARANKQKFVPYRESKLTRLLRSSLEGTCSTSMIICISPSILHFDETYYTLEYGRRAQCISGTALTSKYVPKSLGSENAAKLRKIVAWCDSAKAAIDNLKPGLAEEVLQGKEIYDIPPTELLDQLLDLSRDSGSNEGSSIPVHRYSPVRRNRQDYTPSRNFAAFGPHQIDIIGHSPMKRIYSNRSVSTAASEEDNHTKRLSMGH